MPAFFVFRIKNNKKKRLFFALVVIDVLSGSNKSPHPIF